MATTAKSKANGRRPAARRPVVWTEEAFEVRPSTIVEAGLGLFSRIPISEGDTIGYYTGKVLDDDQANRPPYVNSLYLVWICTDYWIWGEGRHANYTRFINHDDKRPNAELITSTRWKTARIGAIRSIGAGDEIFFDYGEEYWDVVDIQKLERTR